MSQQQELNSAIPDLRELPLDLLVELGDSDSVLANEIAMCLQRIKGNEPSLNSFNSGI